MPNFINLLKRIPFLSASYRQRDFHFQMIEKELNTLEDILISQFTSPDFQDGIFSFPYEDEMIKFDLSLCRYSHTLREILKNGTFYEVEILNDLHHRIKPSAVIADVGANIGNHTIFFSRICRAKTVYSFEPQKVAGVIFKKNMLLNQIQNVIFFDKGLSHEILRGDFNQYHSSNIGMTSFTTGEEGRFEFITLDSLKLPTLDFIKIDVEGNELNVLKGGYQTLNTYSPDLLVEIWPQNTKPVHKFLTSSGYHLIKQYPGRNFLYSKK